MNFKKIPFFFLLIVFLFSHLVYPLSEPSVNTVDNTGTSLPAPSYYKKYMTKDDFEYRPKKLSFFKLVSYPVMFIASPVIFPAYYTYTDEPEIKKSISNYFDWISVTVPVDLEEVKNIPITFPNPVSVKDIAVDVREQVPLAYAEVKKDDLKELYRAINKKEKGVRKKNKKKVKKTKKKRKEKNREPDKNKPSIVVLEKRESKDIKTAEKGEVGKKEISKIAKKKRFPFFKVKKKERKNKNVIRKIVRKDGKTIEKVEAPENLKGIKTAEVEKKRDKLSFEKYFKKAEKYFSSKNYDKAGKYYKKVLIYNPDHELSKRRLNTIKYIREFQKKKEELQRKEKGENISGKKYSEKRIKKLLKKARKAYYKGNFNKAINYSLEVLRNDINNAEAKALINQINEEIRLAKMEDSIRQIASQ